MAYPDNKPTGEYALRDYDFATLDTNKLPIDEYLFKNGYKNAEESLVDSVPDAHNANWLYDVLYRNTRYNQQVAEENKRLLATKIATTSDIGQIQVGYGLDITTNGVLSVQKTIAEDANIISYDLPVGSYMLWAGKNTPEYFIEPAGQTLLKSTYVDLWQFAQDNDLIGKLFTDINDTSFKVNDIRGNFIKIANSNAQTGKFTQAGLPNITGIIDSMVINEDATATSSGALKVVSQSTSKDWGWEGDGTNKRYRIDFNASRSNSIYGGSSTVMPANWGLKLILKALPTPPSNAVPTGTILNYTGTSAPDGYIIANGAELSRITFNKLFNWAVSNNLVKNQNNIPKTAHGYYGTGNGSTTFTIPDLRGVFTRWSDSGANRGGANVGVYQVDGVPNINGTFKAESQGTGSCTNAFTASVSKHGVHSGSGGAYENTYSFDASRSNSAYGRTNEVRPKSVTLFPILKY